MKANAHVLQKFIKTHGLRKDWLALQLGITGYALSRLLAGKNILNDKWANKFKKLSGLQLEQFTIREEQ